MTANLNINYKAPTRADQFIVIKVRLEEAKGRKSRVSGVVEDMAGTVLAEARYVPPRLSFPNFAAEGTVRSVDVVARCSCNRGTRSYSTRRRSGICSGSRRSLKRRSRVGVCRSRSSCLVGRRSWLNRSRDAQREEG